ncbi:MAG: hypothetical protein DIU68_003520, partial [Chloroflexota bacterium]
MGQNHMIRFSTTARGAGRSARRLKPSARRSIRSTTGQPSHDLSGSERLVCLSRDRYNSPALFLAGRAPGDPSNRRKVFTCS